MLACSELVGVAASVSPRKEPTIHTERWAQLRETGSLSWQGIAGLDKVNGIRRGLLYKLSLEDIVCVALANRQPHTRCDLSNSVGVLFW